MKKILKFTTLITMITIVYIFIIYILNISNLYIYSFIDDYRLLIYFFINLFLLIFFIVKFDNKKEKIIISVIMTPILLTIITNISPNIWNEVEYLNNCDNKKVYSTRSIYSSDSDLYIEKEGEIFSDVDLVNKKITLYSQEKVNFESLKKCLGKIYSVDFVNLDEE